MFFRIFQHLGRLEHLELLWVVKHNEALNTMPYPTIKKLQYHCFPFRDRAKARNPL